MPLLLKSIHFLTICCRLSNKTSAADQDITGVYANCIKLCTENKINQKNSWQLPLIDYMNDVMKTKHGELTNFQVRSEEQEEKEEEEERETV